MKTCRWYVGCIKDNFFFWKPDDKNVPLDDRKNVKKHENNNGQIRKLDIWSQKQLDPSPCLSMQGKIQGTKSPASCAGLDRTLIKGRQSREPILFVANRMSKCFSPRTLLWVKTESSAVPALQFQSLALTSWMSALMRRERKDIDKDVCKGKKVQEMKRELEMCLMLPAFF